MAKYYARQQDLRQMMAHAANALGYAVRFNAQLLAELKTRVVDDLVSELPGRNLPGQAAALCREIYDSSTSTTAPPEAGLHLEWLKARMKERLEV